MLLNRQNLDLIDELVRLLGWPAILAALVWVIRIYDAGQREFKEIGKNTEIAIKGVAEVKAAVDTIQTNHLAHLQQGITRLAESNDTAVIVLQNIDKGIGILTDRLPRE
jgi:hypothetical protein